MSSCYLFFQTSKYYLVEEYKIAKFLVQKEDKNGNSITLFINCCSHAIQLDF